MLDELTVFNTYTQIRAMMEEVLAVRMNWDRNQIMNCLEEVLASVADEEIAYLKAQYSNYELPPR